MKLSFRNGLIAVALAAFVAWIASPWSLNAAAPAGAAPKASDGSQQLTILHSNDVHGHLMPFSYPIVPGSRRASMTAGTLQGSGLAGVFEFASGRNIGGIARRATIAANIRKELAAKGTPVWLIDAGDTFHYSPFSLEYHGDADVLAMNAAGYDFGGFGNHEFDVSPDQFKKFVGDAKFTYLCANLTDIKTKEPVAKRYEIRQVGDVRVGIFGLVTSVSRSQAARDTFQCDDYSEVAPKVVAELRGAQKADIVILISHIGESSDRRLASDVQGIDVIVGAHSHTRLPDGEVVPWSSEMKSDEINGTVIVQAGQWGAELGRLDLLVKKNADGKWRVSRYHTAMIPVTSDIAEDPAVKATLDKLWAPHAAKYDEVLATATADFGERGDDLAQNFLYADSVRATMGVDIEFDRSGGSFWPIVAGPVTRGALVDLEQNNGTVVTFKMKGSDIRKYVEQSTPVASGLRYRALRGKLEAITVGDAPLDDAHVYSCAANSSLVGRMDGFGLVDQKDTGKSWAEVVRDGIRKAGTITPAYDGRRIVVSAPRSTSRPSTRAARGAARDAE